MAVDQELEKVEQLKKLNATLKEIAASLKSMNHYLTDSNKIKAKAAGVTYYGETHGF